MNKVSSIVFIILFPLAFFGQYTSEESSEKKNPLSNLSFKDRLYWTGNIGLNYYNSVFYLNLSPQVGYRFTQKFSAGVGARYVYIGSNYYQFKTTIYGGNAFTRYNLTDNLFAHAEFERLRSYDFNPNSTNYGGRAMANMLFVGAGYSNRIGGNGSVNIMLLYDAFQSPNSPYQNSYLFGPLGPPIIYRLSFGFGI